MRDGASMVSKSVKNGAILRRQERGIVTNLASILAGKRLLVAGKHRYGSPFTSRLQYQMAGNITRVTNIRWRLRMRTNCVAIDGISMDWKKLIQIKEII